MSVYYCALCETAHDSVGDATRCCSEEFDEDPDDDQGAAPVAMADGGVPVDEALAGDGVSAASWRLNRADRSIRMPREVFTRYGYDDGDRLDLVVDDDGLHFLRDAEACDDAGLPADGDWAERWQEQARANVDEWGIQDRETLLLAAQEELGELTQAALEAAHEDGDPERIQAEVDDLGALLVQLTALLPDDNDELVTDGGTTTRRRQTEPEVDPRAATIQYLRDLLDQGDSQIVLARHISSATRVSSHKAGRVLARLAGDTDSIGDLEGDVPDDLQVERAWQGSNAVRWSVLREGTNPETEGSE